MGCFRPVAVVSSAAVNTEALISPGRGFRSFWRYTRARFRTSAVLVWTIPGAAAWLPRIPRAPGVCFLPVLTTRVFRLLRSRPSCWGEAASRAALPGCVQPARRFRDLHF